jgi:exopolysaccharide production protein ExoZ
MGQTFYPGLHALRGFAALCVLVQHVAYWSVNNAGAGAKTDLKLELGTFGVLMFFCISGFVIGSLRHTATLEFITRRLLRIYPGYWAALLIAVVISASPLTFDIKTFLLLPVTELRIINIPYWTLIFEVVFYALTAIVFALRMSDRALTMAVIGWIVIIQLGHGAADVNPAYAPGGWIIVSTYNQFFALGLLCAVNLQVLRKLSPLAWMSVALGCFVACELAKALLPGAHDLAYAVFLSSIMMASTHVTSVPKTAKLLGDASYGLYLIHVPVIAAVIPAIAPLQLPLWQIVAIVFSSTLAAGLLFGSAEHRLNRRLGARLSAHVFRKVVRRDGGVESTSGRGMSVAPHVSGMP